MAKSQHTDTIDCLLAELKDAYEATKKALAYNHCGDECVMILREYADDSQASIERAYQLVSDLKAVSDEWDAFLKAKAAQS